MKLFIEILYVAAIVFFLVVGSMTIASKKLTLFERLAAFLCTLFINTYYLVSLILFARGK